MSAPGTTDATTDPAGPASGAARPGDRRPGGRPAATALPRGGTATMWRVEMAKLVAQARVRIVLALCVVGPVLFIVALALQDAVPSDTLFGRWVHESGWAVALVVLGFSGQYALPIVVIVVAGDICAEEDRLSTWSLLLTRSRTRTEVLGGKIAATATYTVAATILLGASATVAGIAAVGTQPVVGLSGSLLPSSTAAEVVAWSWLSAIPPSLAIAAIAVAISLVSRNSWVGVIVPVALVLLLDVVSLLSAIDPIRPYLPTTGYDAWHGLARAGAYDSPVWTSLAVSAAWVLVACVVAAAVIRRRDVTAA